MKRIIFLFTLFITAVLTGCMQDQSIVTIQETGVVTDYAGAGNCKYVIELDNGSRIQPMHCPGSFNFAQGQRVLVEYIELPDVISTCDRGAASEIVYIEELNCQPYIDLYFHNYDSLPRDPVFIHEAFVDGECLEVKLSYSGGCREHTIDLARMNPLNAGSSDIPAFEIRHNANGDRCEALFTKNIRFDLTPLKEEGKKEFVLTANLSNGEVYNEIFELNYQE
ncbi:MAG: hypothetical protein ACOCVA_03615 [Prolixibacteraceae bacterium]